MRARWTRVAAPKGTLLGVPGVRPLLEPMYDRSCTYGDVVTGRADVTATEATMAWLTVAEMVPGPSGTRQLSTPALTAQR